MNFVSRAKGAFLNHYLMASSHDNTQEISTVLAKPTALSHDHDHDQIA